MASIWDRFDSVVTADEVEEARENVFEKPIEGEHRIELLSIEPAETQQGSPILKFKFKDVKNGKLIAHSMFLSNMNYPEQTPRAIAQVINFVQELTGEEIKFTSMGSLEDDIRKIDLSGLAAVINVTYKTPESKYPQISVIERLSDVETEL